MTTPALIGPTAGLFKKSTMREMLQRVEHEAAVAMGFENAEDRMVSEVNKNDDAYWKLKQLQARVEPKEVNMTADNSAEALLAALEAKRNGQYVEFEEVQKAEIVAEDAKFKQGGFRAIKGVAVTI